jgi:Carboxypeptidase regulatory-like domain
MKSCRFTLLLVMLLLCTFAGVQMAGQNILTGEIDGTVTDPSGAVVSGATVTLKNTEMGIAETVTTNAGGGFRLPLLKPATYQLAVTQAGFRTVSQNVSVGVGQVVTANLHLEVGRTSEIVEVSGAAPMLETENANLQTTYSAAQVENLPNGGNDITAYAYTTPGVTLNTSSGGGYGNFTAFGLPATSNLFTVNGNDEMDPYLNLNNSGATNLLLGAAEVDEVGVTSNGYTGQYGRMAGAQVNYVTKSGTNNFHGKLNYLYNEVNLNAADWFLNHTVPKTAPGFDINHQYAAAIGGPIVKDKLFFFVGTEGLRYVLATSNPIFLPNAAFQNAILTNLPTAGVASSASVPFYQNMFNLINSAPGFASSTPDTAAGFGCGDLNTPAPGGPGAVPGFTQFGDPSVTAPGTGGTPCANTFRSTVGALSTEWLVYGKADWVRSSTDRWSMRVKTDHGLQPTFTDFINPAVFNATSTQPQWEGQVTNTRTLTPNVLNQFIGSVSWYSAIFRQTNAALAQSTFPYRLQDATGTFGNPNTIDFMGGEQAVFPQGRNVTQYQLVDDVSVTKGNHGLKFGGNFRRDDITDAILGVRTIPRARIFSTTDFALGFIDQFSQRFPKSLEERVNAYSFGVYLQDEWRANSKLKLTLTVRLDRNSNVGCPGHCFSRLATQFSSLNHDPTIPYNQMIRTNLNTAFPQVQAIVAQPRFGFAYNILQNTVLRGGVGMFSDLYPATLADNFLAQAPFDPTFTIAGLLAPQEGAASAASTAAGCNSVFQSVFSGGGTAADYLAAAPAGCRVPDYHDVANNFRNPMYVQWNLQLQQTIGKRSVFSVNYVGNHGYDEFIYNDLANSRDTNAADFGLPVPAGLPSPSGLPAAYPDSRIRNLQSLSNGSTSNYHGLTASFSQRALYGLQFNAAYTWSHALDSISNGGILPYSGNDSQLAASNPFNLKALNYSNADYDVRHNFSANYVWQIPSHSQGLRERVLGGWTLSGTWYARSGYPFTMQDTGMAGIYGNSTGFAIGYSPLPYSLTNTIPDCSGHNQTTGCFGSNVGNLFGFASLDNPNFFCTTPGVGGCTASGVNPAFWDGGFGHTRRNTYRGPHYFSSDFSILKNFKLTERVGFGIGANMYNVFNHPNFANANHDLASTGTVGISTVTVEPATSPYGAFVGSAVSGRVIQLNAKLNF